MGNIDKFKFNPENGWNDTATFPNKQDESKNRDMFNKLPFQLRDFINILIDILESSESDSGSAHIGAYMIEGLKNTDNSDALTVKEQIEALKRLVDSKSDSEDVYSKENSYSKSETDKLLEIKADDENVYHKNDIEKVLDMTYGSIKSINNIVSTKGNISIVAGAGIKVEIDSTTKTIRIISTGSGTGDMLKDVYDTDNDGIVDNANALGGQSPEYYAKQDDMEQAQTDIVNNSKQVCVNLLNPKLQTTTQLGVTFTNNGDGTYTLNGANTNDWNQVILENIIFSSNFKAKFIGLTSEMYSKGINLNFYNATDDISTYINNEDGVIVDVIANKQYMIICVAIKQIEINETVKPMLTTNLNATYDDFVPYTGDGKRLNECVSDLVLHPQVNNPNLLINGDFRVNQRGKSSYGDGYGIDMWLAHNDCIVNLNNDGSITIPQSSNVSEWFGQFIEVKNMDSWLNKTYTISIELGDGTIHSGTVKPTNNSGAYVAFSLNGGDVYLQFGWGTDKFLVCFNRLSLNGDITIKYIKLELGNVATPLSPRPYGEELALCERYAYIQGNSIGVCTEVTSDVLVFFVPLTTTMRVKPSFVGTPNDNSNGYQVYSSTGSAQTGFTFTVRYNTKNGVYILASKTGHGLTGGVLRFGGVSGFTAEL